MDSSHGGTLAGYAIEGVLGQGGMGTVYRARHPRLPRSVALKLLNADVSTDPELRARFEREANVVAHLDHPGIVGIHDRGLENGQPWFAMQYIEGTDASRLDPRTVSVERAVRIVGEVAAALDYAHSHGVLHRDVKPANILLTTTQAGRVERAVLTDFGIARLMTANTQLTSTGTFTATLAYASPEQLSGIAVDHRTDQYSLACTLFALLCGRTPFAANDPGQVVAGHLSRPVPPLDRPDVPPQLNAVIARAMSKNPAERFASTGEFAAAALRAVSGQAFAYQPQPPLQFQHQPAPHNTWPSAPANQYFPSPAVPPQGWPAAPHHRGAPRPSSPWPAGCALAFGFFLVLFESTASRSGRPSMLRDLHGSLVEADWLDTAYLLFATVPMLFAGRLGDRFGPKNMYVIGMALFLVAALTSALSPNFAIAIVAHAVQGLGVAMIVPQTLAVITRTFPPGKRGAALGLWGGAGGAATLLGPAVADAFVNYFTWRWIFLLGLPLGVVAIALGAALIPTLPAQRSNTDPLGVLLSGTGVLLLVLSVEQGLAQGWTVWGFGLVGGLLVFGLFLLVQARSTSDPLLPGVVLRDRNWWLSGFATVVMTASISALLIAVTISLEVVHGAAVVFAAMVLVPAALITGSFSPIMGNVADRMHPAIIPTLGFALSAIAAGGIAVAMTIDANPTLAFALIGAVLAFGSACVWGPLAAAATRVLPPHRAGVGGGIYATVYLIGPTFGSVAFSKLIGSEYRSGGGLDTGLRNLGLLAVGLLAAGAIATALFIRRNPAPTTPAPGFPVHAAQSFH
ncbi:hypothetical protein C5E45_27365 [Nocardia nova]|uniref:Uncharacterized protein n=1 Tax=Nocardia nova TaxID=37330 RepID=A0A2S6AIW6_9NOCA|nr:MDR family MFS transporter [Nocardia nova]PPJ31629.1 hypothetical protein C5E41_06895 [Nocardia nova]PPJ35168.1 hypothetical protein C5E45_27365 [Nocardia nova]